MPDGCFRKYFLLKVLYPWEAFLVGEPDVGQGDHDEDVAQEADGEDDDQVGDEEHLVVPDGLRHAILLLPSLACFKVGRGAVVRVQAMFVFRMETWKPENQGSHCLWKRGFEHLYDSDCALMRPAEVRKRKRTKQ